jgi:hypothetical protein
LASTEFKYFGCSAANALAPIKINLYSGYNAALKIGLTTQVHRAFLDFCVASAERIAHMG